MTSISARSVVGAVLALPALALTAVFVAYPIARTVYLTFFDYSFITDESTFIGLGNYIEWFGDERMHHSLVVSLVFFALYVPASMIIGMLIAVLIDRLANKVAANIYRSIFYFPVVLPAAIVFQMWLWLYDPTLGMFAHLQVAAGAEHGLNWMGDPNLALPGLAIMSIWRLVGETVVFFLVGLAAIPRDYSEAARIDGATEWRIFRSIILPLMLPMIFLVFVMRLKVLELIVEPLFMTQGGPIDATMTYGLQAYYLFNHDDRVGYANTWFVLMAIIAITAAVIANRGMRRYQA